MRYIRCILFTILLTILFMVSAQASVTLPQGLTIIDAQAFQNDTSLTGTLVIPSSVIEIGVEAYSGCTALTRVSFPDAPITIGSRAFAGCTGLKGKVYLCEGSTVAEDAFDGCDVVVLEKPLATPAEYFTYTFDIFGQLELTGFDQSCGVTNVVIPKYIGDNPVIIIGEAFRSCGNLTSVTIPDGVTTIGDDAFSWCSNLISVTIPDSVTTIGDYAFTHCSNLISVTIPSSVTSIGMSAFDDCLSLTSVTIPDGVTIIQNDTFESCWNLTSVTIPDGVTTIGNHAFESCYNLTSVTIPDSVKIIGIGAFGYCGLTSVTIPDGVTTIGNHAFESCELTSITIPDSVTTIGNHAFGSCDKLTSVTIPDGVTSIGDYAFSWCRGLTGNLVLPDSVTSIGECAFYCCYGLNGSLVLPDALTEIGDEAFCECSGLSGSLYLPSTLQTIGTGAFKGCRNLTGSLILPNQITSIPEKCFSYCSGLTSVQGKKLTSIGNDAFLGCDNLTAIYLEEALSADSCYRDDVRLRYVDKETGLFTDANGDQVTLLVDINMAVEYSPTIVTEAASLYHVHVSIENPGLPITSPYEESGYTTQMVEDPKVTIYVPDNMRCSVDVSEDAQKTLSYDQDGNPVISFEHTDKYSQDVNFSITFYSNTDINLDTTDITFEFSSANYPSQTIIKPVSFPIILNSDAIGTDRDFTFDNQIVSMTGSLKVSYGAELKINQSEVNVENVITVDSGIISMNSAALSSPEGLQIGNKARVVLNDSSFSTTGFIYIHDATLVLNSGTVSCDRIWVSENGTLEVHGGTLTASSIEFASNKDHTGKIDGGTIRIKDKAVLNEHFRSSGNNVLEFYGNTLDVNQNASLNIVKVFSDITQFVMENAFQCASFCFDHSTLGMMASDAKTIINALEYAQNKQTIEQTNKVAANEAQQMFIVRMGYLCSIPLGTSNTTKELWQKTAIQALTQYASEVLSETNDQKISTIQGLSTILYNTTLKRSYTIGQFNVSIRPLTGITVDGTLSSAGIVELYEENRKVMDFVYAPSEEGAQLAIQKYTTIAQEDLYAVFKQEFNKALTDGVPGGKYLNTLLGMYEDAIFDESKLVSTLETYAASKVDEAVLNRLPKFKEFSKFYKKYRAAFIDLTKMYDGKYDGGSSMVNFLNDVAELLK